MSAKKAAAKKKAPAGKKKPAKKASTAASRPSKAKLKTAHKPSAKTGKSAKKTSVKKVSTKLAAPKDQPKPSGKKTIATLPPKKPGSGPPPPIRLAPKPIAAPVAPRRRSGGNVLSGPVKGFTYTINQQDVRATKELPPKWGSRCDSKWITKKGDSC